MTERVYWAALTIDYINSIDGYQVVITSDITVHCFCRYSRMEPQKHVIPKKLRGTFVGSYIDQCFVAFKDLEQDEDGDTLTHTFTFTDWLPCETLWFYFWATKVDSNTKSATPLFKHHRILGLKPADCQRQSGQWGGFMQGWGADGQSFQPDHNYNAAFLYLWFAHIGDARKGYFNVDIRKAGGNCWEEVLLYTTTLYSETFDPRPEGTKILLRLDPLVPLLSGIDYHICLYTIPPWYGFIGGEWVLRNDLAAMWYAKKSHGSTYPRGTMLKGCGFNQGAGSWASFPNDDIYFCIYEAYTKE